VPYRQIPPQLPSAVKQIFLSPQITLQAALARMAEDRGWSMRAPSGQEADQASLLVYEAALLGVAKLRFPHTKSRQTHSEERAYLLPMSGDALDWEQAQVELDPRHLGRNAEEDAYFDALPAELGDARSLSAWKKEFEDYLYYNSVVTIWHNPHLDLYSKMGESAEAYQKRCREAAEEALTDEAKKLKAKYEREMDRLEDKLAREERELEKDRIEHEARKQEELLSGAESLLGLFTKRRISRGLSTASRRRRMTRQAEADIKESEEVIEDLEEDIDELEEEAKREAEELVAKWESRLDEVEEVEVRPRRADVQIDIFALAWLPRWEVRVGEQAFSMPAYEAEGVE
jgi:hypothetical protein